MKIKYKVMFEYDIDKYTFEEEEFNGVGEAVNYAMDLGYTCSFIIVQVVDWKELTLKP